MKPLDSAGLSVEIPPGWEGRISGGEVEDGARGGERSPALLHVANFALPPAVAEYGSGAVELMGPRHVFAALVEFARASAGEALFTQRTSLPLPLQPAWFDAFRLQRVIPGQAGAQQFFTSAGRAFCLYVVLGSGALRRMLLPAANEVLGTLRIEPG